MPDRGAPVDTVRAARPIHVGTVTLLPVERVRMRVERGRSGAAWLVAAAEPYALIVRDAGGIRAVPIGAAEVSLEQLRDRIPGLDAVLSGPR